MFNLPGQDLSIIHCPCNRYSSPNPCQPTIRDLRAAVGGDGDRVTHLEIVCIWWKYFIQYKNQLIYTWSGLFCNASHHYKRVPIYTLQAKLLSIGQGRNKCGTHILAIAVGAYQDVVQTGNNQSILVTGETAADRTENTKKVVSYCANICTSNQPGYENLEKW